jgi:tetratricopeptide (TPR) repeat protein
MGGCFRVRLARFVSVVVIAAGTVFVLSGLINRKMTDYQVDVATIEREIAALNNKPSRRPGDGEKTPGLVYLYYLMSSLTGNPDHFRMTGIEIDKTIRTTGPSEELYLARANLNVKRHRLQEARADLEMLPDWPERPSIRALKADIDLQAGQYEKARQAYESVIQHDRSWDNLARLAYLRSITGDISGAEALYVEAQEEITAKEMRSYAWLELQRGMLDLNHGRQEEALAHYRRADRAYSGYWLVEEYLAEALGAQRKYDDAVTVFEQVISSAPRPEVYQALGDLYVCMGKPDQAKSWHDRALEAYLESVRHGEVLYFHHLATFYADVREDGAEAIKWARKDLALRHNFATRDTLAWALYRNGQYAEALVQINEALTSGVKEARLFFHAAMIHLAAGHTVEGKRFLQLAAEINPRYDSFHVHR